MVHGTMGRQRKGCECLPCRAAYAQYKAQLRRRKHAQARAGQVDVPHGTVTGYDYYGCRESCCRAANAARMRAYRARGKVE